MIKKKSNKRELNWNLCKNLLPLKGLQGEKPFTSTPPPRLSPPAFFLSQVHFHKEVASVLPLRRRESWTGEKEVLGLHTWAGSTLPTPKGYREKPCSQLTTLSPPPPHLPSASQAQASHLPNLYSTCRACWEVTCLILHFVVSNRQQPMDNALQASNSLDYCYRCF